MMLPLVILTGITLAAAWRLRASLEENRTLKTELATLRLAHRAANSRESLAADSLRRVTRLEEALALMRGGAAEAGDRERAAELERVIVFLRGEITAAQETIERLKQDTPTARASRP